MSSQSTRITRRCLICGKEFQVLPWEDKRRGGVKYCSRACYHASQAIPLEVQFSRSVGSRTESGCTLWTGVIDHNGYGIIYSSTHKREQRTFLAHRVAWELANGGVPEGVCVLHRCDNPPCVNVEHLFLGTQIDNIEDMAKKERQANRRITADIARLIRSRYAAGGVSQQRLAEEYGIDQTSVSRIILGKSWRFAT